MNERLPSLSSKYLVTYEDGSIDYLYYDVNAKIFISDKVVISWAKIPIGLKN